MSIINLFLVSANNENVYDVSGYREMKRTANISMKRREGEPLPMPNARERQNKDDVVVQFIETRRKFGQRMLTSYEINDCAGYRTIRGKRNPTTVVDSVKINRVRRQLFRLGSRRERLANDLLKHSPLLFSNLSEGEEREGWITAIEEVLKSAEHRGWWIFASTLSCLLGQGWLLAVLHGPFGNQFDVPLWESVICQCERRKFRMSNLP